MAGVTAKGIEALLPLLSANDDPGIQRELERLAQADAYTATIIISDGALLHDNNHTLNERLDDALDALHEPMPDECPEKFDELAINRQYWAYRVGLVTGLRLARLMSPE